MLEYPALQLVSFFAILGATDLHWLKTFSYGFLPTPGQFVAQRYPGGLRHHRLRYTDRPLSGHPPLTPDPNRFPNARTRHLPRTNATNYGPSHDRG